MEDYSTIVDVAVAQLTNEGRLVPTEDQEQSYQKFLITARSAWLIFGHNANIGLLRKDSGSNWNGMSTDVIMDKSDGTWADIASSRAVGEGLYQAYGTWQPNDNVSTDPDWLSRWIEPTEELAEVVPDNGGTPPPIDILEALEAINASLGAIEVQIAALNDKIVSVENKLDIHMKQQTYSDTIFGNVKLVLHPDPWV